MLAHDRDALICDMAETYRIYDIKSVPLTYLAVLASGLGMDSRIRLREQGLKADWSTVMMAMLIDAWSKSSENALLPRFIEKQSAGVKSDSKVFTTPEDFEAAKAAILGGHTDG